MKKKALILLSRQGYVGYEAIFVENISGKKNTTISLVDKTGLNDLEVVFSWNKVKDVDVYHLRVVKPSFNNTTKTMSDRLITKTIVTKTFNPDNYVWSFLEKKPEYETQETKSYFTIN